MEGKEGGPPSPRRVRTGAGNFAIFNKVTRASGFGSGWEEREAEEEKSKEIIKKLRN